MRAVLGAASMIPEVKSRQSDRKKKLAMAMTYNCITIYLRFFTGLENLRARMQM